MSPQAPGTSNPPVETDAIVIGAGPVGLFQVFELGLLEIRAHVIDSLPFAGGQCMELYPDKPIYDIPALEVCTGRELTQRLLQQIKPFGASFHLGQEVTVLRRQDDGRFLVETNRGTRLLGKVVIIAAGVGAFQPRPLRVPGLERHEGNQLHYQVSRPADFAGKHLLLAGGGDSAVDWALHFAGDGPERVASVTLVHRRDVFKAAPASLNAMQALRAAGRLRFVVGQVTGIEEAGGRLLAAIVTDAEQHEHRVPLDHLLVFFGLSPKLGPIAGWGLDIERRQLKVDTETFSTSVPGIFAVGDINTYPGKKKLILCGFHECVLAAFGAVPFVFPERRMMLEYTTTSTRLHGLLGVASPVSDPADGADT